MPGNKLSPLLTTIKNLLPICMVNICSANITLPAANMVEVESAYLLLLATGLVNS